MMPHENETTEHYEISCVAPDGVGYGEGTISTEARVRDAEAPITPEQLRQAVDIIVAHRDEVIVPVEEDDDGCGDGRPTRRVFQTIDGATGQVREYNVSKLRAKIFGGGLQVASSMWRAVAGAPLRGETVLGDREFIAAELKKRGISYGGHTDNHAHGENCGCGALDKYAHSVKLSGAYHDEISQTAQVFYGPDAEATSPALERAFASRTAISNDERYMSNASGRQTMNLMERDGAVIKELGDQHFEAIDIFNEEPGTTVDQEKVAELFAAAGLPDNIHVFAVDVWRGRMYADAVADIAAGHGYERDEARATALADFFINQLSVSAALTDGTQPVVYNRLAASQ